MIWNVLRDVCRSFESFRWNATLKTLIATERPTMLDRGPDYQMKTTQRR